VPILSEDGGDLIPSTVLPSDKLDLFVTSFLKTKTNSYFKKVNHHAKASPDSGTSSGSGRSGVWTAKNNG
jgi:hypothetical protein